MKREPFRHKAVHDYAERHGLDYAWEGTTAFAKRLRTLSPDQFQVLTVHTLKGVRKVLLFSKEISRAEKLALDAPRRARLEAMRKARLDRLRVRKVRENASKAHRARFRRAAGWTP